MDPEDASASVCDHCGERRPAGQFLESESDGVYCYHCIRKENCDRCGQELFVLEDSTWKEQVLCTDCLDESQTENLRGRVLSLLKAVVVGIIGVLVSLGIRAIDEIVVLLIRGFDVIVDHLLLFLDTGISLLRSGVESVILYRPVLPPIVSLYQEWIAFHLAMAFLVVGIFVIAFDSLGLMGPQLFNLLTFPGTIVHEWAHKTMCEWYGVRVIDKKYFQLDNQLGFVNYQPPRPFRESIGINVAPLLLNTIVAVLIAASGTFFQEHLELWGLIVIYWLAFSIGTRALPSHGDIDNIWKRIRKEWRENRIYLLAVPLVLVLRLAQMLKIAYSGAIYGALTVVTGRLVVYLVS